MKRNDRHIENLQRLKKALSLLKNKTDIYSYECNRTFSKDHSENFQLVIEFELPDDIPTDLEISTSNETESRNDTNTFSTISTTTNSTSTIKESTNKSSSTFSSTPDTSTQSSLVSLTIFEDPKIKKSSNYQALDTLIFPSVDKNVEINIYLKSFKQNNKKEGILEKITIEIDPYQTTLKEIIKLLLPNKKVKNVIRNGVYFVRKNFDVNIAYEEKQKWKRCCDSQLDISISKIYGSTTEREFKMTFVVNNVG
uniref:Uncharacterized protein n=1 Tax=Strongyloides stercoralis TaxID=6248 RepID=A0AAF5CQJ1_STRER